MHFQNFMKTCSTITFLTTPHGYDVEFSVNDHVVMIKESYVINSTTSVGSVYSSIDKHSLVLHLKSENICRPACSQ